MFESAEIGHTLEKAAYKRQEPRLRIALLDAQRRLAASDVALVIIVGGVEGSGKTEFANQLLEWIDARGVSTHTWGAPTDEERERPYFWRFWRILPPRGKAALLLTSWYSSPIVDHVFKNTTQARTDQRLDQIADFEHMLHNEHVVLVKLWFHITRKEQSRRFKQLEADPHTRWRVTGDDWTYHKRYGRFRTICEHALMKTSTGENPWHIIDAGDRRYRDVAAARAILDTLAPRLKEARPAAGKPARAPGAGRLNIIRHLDLALSLDKKTFDARLETLQGRLGLLTRSLRRKQRSLTIAMEGPDAAGKGGAIRRLTQAIDVRLYRVDSVAAPTDEEKARPYLWRFWRDLPRTGRVTIYDRSWYGRVLVERVEGFAAPAEWRRAYAEINAFEEQLAEAGIIVLKFWIAISAAEQLRRFKDRQLTPYKQYKITEEDWRNRARWNAYEAAACEMIERTSTHHAPWVLVEGEDKRWARIKVLDAVVSALERAL